MTSKNRNQNWPLLGRRIVCGAVLAAMCVWGAPQKQKKPPDAVVLDAKALRAENSIQLEGRVRANAEKPLRGIVLVFDLLSPEGGVVGSARLDVDDGLLEVGEERAYHAATSEHARAVAFKVRAFDANERELRVDNAGPFSID